MVICTSLRVNLKFTSTAPRLDASIDERATSPALMLEESYDTCHSRLCRSIIVPTFKK